MSCTSKIAIYPVHKSRNKRKGIVKKVTEMIEQYLVSFPVAMLPHLIPLRNMNSTIILNSSTATRNHEQLLFNLPTLESDLIPLDIGKTFIEIIKTTKFI